MHLNIGFCFFFQFILSRFLPTCFAFPKSRVQDDRLRDDARGNSGKASEGDGLAPGVAGVAGLHTPEDFGPLAAAAVVESDALREAIR